MLNKIVLLLNGSSVVATTKIVKDLDAHDGTYLAEDVDTGEQWKVWDIVVHGSDFICDSYTRN